LIHSEEKTVAFAMTLSFATIQARDAFADQELSRVHGQQVEPSPVADAEAAEPARIAVEVRSPTSAKEVCRLVESFLRHSKDTRIDLTWTDANGDAQVGWISSGSSRDADLLAIQIGAAAKAVLDKEKEAAEPTPAPS
jgi:hypothetical protein